MFPEMNKRKNNYIYFKQNKSKLILVGSKTYTNHFFQNLLNN